MNTPTDDPRELMRRLDELIPSNQEGDIGPITDPLIDIARQIAELPRITLSESTVSSIEVRLRDAAVILGTPTSHLPRWGGRHILLVLVAVVAFMVALWIIFDTDREDNPTRPIPTESPTTTLTMTPTTTPTPTLTPSLIVTVSITPSRIATLFPSITPTAAPVGTLVIEGPVEAIEGTTVVIYDILVQLDPQNPLTPTIQVGDLLHVEGEIGVIGDRIIVLALVTVLVDVDVYIGDSGELFRDDAPCDTPPPAWAPAYRWRARCEGGQPPSDGMGDEGMGDSDD